MEHLAFWLSSVILIPSFALVSGVLTKTNRTFEVLYMLIGYLGPFNKMPFLDFLGTNSADGASWISDIGLYFWVMSFIYILVSIGFLTIAFVSRSRFTQTT